MLVCLFSKLLKDVMVAPKLTIAQRMELVELFFMNNKNSRIACSRFKDRHPDIRKPCHTTVIRLVARFRATGRVDDLPRSGRRRSGTSEEMATFVVANYTVNPHLSTRQVATDIGSSQSSVLRCLKQEKFHPYKIVRTQVLSEDDFDRRVEFCEWALAKFDDDDSFGNNVIFSDEASFSLTGEVNKQNWRFWSDSNPHWMEAVNDQGAPKVMVWAAVWREHVIGPFFFQTNVTSESYLEMLTTQLWPAIQQQIDVNTWMMQDGAPPHYGIIVRNWLNEKFPEKWIGRRGSVEWPPRSPDLTPLDFFLWGYLKSKVYQTRPQTLQELRQRIERICATVTVEMLTKVRLSWINRLRVCALQHGEQFEHLL